MHARLAVLTLAVSTSTGVVFVVIEGSDSVTTLAQVAGSLAVRIVFAGTLHMIRRRGQKPPLPGPTRIVATPEFPTIEHGCRPFRIPAL